MILRLVWQSLARRPGRSLLLLAGYALGVGVTVALLSIGDALVEQSRDRDLLGGGDLLVLPAGIDVETLKTGGVSSLYFRIDRASYFYREVLTSPRFAGAVEAAAPWIDDELLYLRAGDTTVAVSAGGEVPSLSRALGVAPDLVAGRWEDGRASARWRAPSDSALRAEIDGFHLPEGPAATDSTWAEWHYFNLRAPDDAWWLYLTYLVGGRIRDGRWGGRLLATLVSADGTERVFSETRDGEEVRFHTDRPDLSVGPSRVTLDAAGRYRILASVPAESGSADTLVVDLLLVPEPRRYLPPVDVSPGGFESGYVVPVLAGTATGRVCDRVGCRDVEDVPAYHDHNWGVWRDVTWDWGKARAGDLSILYGGVRRAAGEGAASAAPGDGVEEGGRFLFVVDSLGLRGVLPIRELVRFSGSAGDGSGPAPPDSIRVEAARGDERLTLRIRVAHARVSRRSEEDDGPDRFVQMRGDVEVEGALLGEPVRASGSGFFETWLRREATSPSGRVQAEERP